MLNIGPRANGKVPYEIADRFEKIGNWLDINGESIYKSSAFDLRSDLHDWGRITAKTENGKTKLYLHVFNWPLDRQLTVTGLQTVPDKIYLLNDKLKTPVPFTHQEVITRISLPFDVPDPYVSVIVMEFDNNPEIVKGLIGESTGGGYALTPVNTANMKGSSKILSPSRFGSIPQRLVIEEESDLEWKIYFDKPGTYSVNASYSFQEENSGKDHILLKVAGQEIKHRIRPTGKTVGEPKSAWVIDSYNSFKLGNINISKPGFYTINLKVKPEKEHTLNFNRLWIEKD
jgi:alpha-L-fucosidase